MEDLASATRPAEGSSLLASPCRGSPPGDNLGVHMIPHRSAAHTLETTAKAEKVLLGGVSEHMQVIYMHVPALRQESWMHTEFVSLSLNVLSQRKTGT